MSNFKINKMIVVTIVLLISILSIGCASTNQQITDTQTASNAEVIMTLDELAKYNGKDENSSYIAVDGIIYDVSNSPQWKSGMHGGNNAGKDISEKVHSAPHGVSKVDGLPVIGKLAK